MIHARRGANICGITLVWHLRSTGYCEVDVSDRAGVLSQGGGLLALYALHLIAGAPRYGNEVMRELETRTKGGWLANPGAIYPLLEVMESRRLIEGEWEEPEKRTRRIYRITPDGEEELERLTSIMRPKLEEAIRILQTMNAELKRGAEEA
jgi:DNA-binding PadR family transcriptional regulator